MRRQEQLQTNPGRGQRPLRVGTTSYILPADILPNVEFLAPLVEDVELVLFESDEISNLPSPSAVEELGRLARSKGLSYTVHLPMDAHLGAPEEPRRLAAVGKCQRVIDLTVPLDPFALIVHFHHDDYKTGIPAHTVPAWQEALRRSVRELLDHGVPSRALCVETLSYPFDLVAGIVEEFDLSVCLDVGHLVLFGFDVAEAIRRYWPRTRVIHIHGVHAGKDHKDLSLLDPDIPLMILSAAHGDPRTGRVLTLEVFNEPDLRGSLAVLERLGLS